jgi:SPP1 gp7 family putative phage head morphogenesis protein
MKSSLLDSHGNQIVRKTANIPNLDPNFWLSTIGGTKISVRDAVEKPFQYHVWVFSCIKSITRNVSQVTHLLTDKKSERAIDTHAVLNILDKPNKLMTQKMFIQAIVSYLLINASNGSGGQCFIVPWNTIKDDKVDLGKGEIPSELFPYSCSYFSPEYKEDTKRQGMRNFIGWKFEIPGRPSSKMVFSVNEIIRIFMINPYDILEGMSPFLPIKTSVEMDAQSDLYNMSNFKNDGRLDGAFTTEQDIDQDRLTDIKNEYWKEYTGVERRRVAFFSGGMKYNQFAKSASEMGYLDQQKWTRAKVLSSYGLNRIAVGDYEDINFATIREGRRLLWYDTYIPMDELIVDSLNYQWINNIENGKYKLISDYSKIPALSNDMKDRAVIGGSLCEKMGLPPSLAARLSGIPLKQEDINKYPFLDEQIPKGTIQQEQNIKALETGTNSSIKIKSIEKGSAYSDNYIKNVLSPVEKKFRIELDKYFYRQRNIIMNNIDDKIKDKSIDFVPKKIDVHSWELFPDESKETLILKEIYKGATKLQVAYEKKQIEVELDRTIVWDTGSTKIDYFTSIRSAYLKNINTNTFKIARDAIETVTEEAMAEGVTVTEFQKRIKQAVHDVYEVRTGRPVIEHGKFDLGGMSSSKTIARTEMGTIASMTRNDVFRSEGIEKIQWITANDEKVRASHNDLNDSVILFGDRYSNGLRFPRDPNGSAGEIINCRCSYIAVFEDK